MKSEKEKMLAGELYNALDPELVEDRKRAQSLTFRFNQTPPEKQDERTEILRALIKSDGDAYIEPSFNCDYGYNIETGKNFYANYNCVILDVCKVVIGDNVLLAPNVQIYAATHPTNPVERLKGLEFAKPIAIGNNVWIGGGAIICPGVTIGDNVTLGAGSVVTKDIPANVIAAGNPCRVIRKISQHE